MIEVEFQVIGDEKIQMTIPIVIKEGASRAPSDLGIHQAGFSGDIFKSTVPEITVKPIVAEVSAKQILIAVVVVVAYAHAVCPANRLKSRLPGDVGKCAIAIVLVKPIGCSGRSALQLGAAEKEDIDPSIVVVVKERATASIGFDDVIIMVCTAVDHRRNEPSGGRNVAKISVKRTARFLGFFLSAREAASHAAEL